METTNIKKVIHGFECEFEEEMGMTSVWICKGGYSASLEYLTQNDELINYTTGTFLPVSPHTIKVICSWANKVGY